MLEKIKTVKRHFFICETCSKEFDSSSDCYKHEKEHKKHSCKHKDVAYVASWADRGIGMSIVKWCNDCEICIDSEFIHHDETGTLKEIFDKVKKRRSAAHKQKRKENGKRSPMSGACFGEEDYD